MSNHDYEGEAEIFFEGRASSKYAVSFCVNFDYSPPQRETRTDPFWPADVLVNSVEVRRNGEKVECPKWLEEMILDAIDDEVLLESVEQEAW